MKIKGETREQFKTPRHEKSLEEVIVESLGGEKYPFLGINGGIIGPL